MHLLWGLNINHEKSTESYSTFSKPLHFFTFCLHYLVLFFKYMVLFFFFFYYSLGLCDKLKCTKKCSIRSLVVYFFYFYFFT